MGDPKCVHVDLLLARLKMKLPDQPPPRLSAEQTMIN